MKRFIYFIIIVSFMLRTDPSVAQCSEFPRLMREADALWQKDNFELAFAKLNSAREVCPEKGKEVDAKNSAFNRDLSRRNNDLKRKTKEAEENLQKARRAEVKAKLEQDKAQKALADVRAANAKNVLLILKEVDDKIYSLKYDEALEKCKVALALGTEWFSQKREKSLPLTQFTYLASMRIL